jgi:maleylacetoacetate isomerase
LAANQGEEKKNEWLQFYINKGLRSVEELLKETSGLYCVGDEVSVADLCLVPQVYSAKRFNIDLAQYPLICAINERLEKLDAFKRAHAHRQPDTLEELREK